MMVSLMNLRLLPPQASEQAARVDTIYLALMGISALIILLLFVLILLGVFRRSSDQRGIGHWIAESRWKVETTWMLVPLVIFLGLFAWGAKEYLTMFEESGEGPTVYVVGRQWMWQSFYPNGYSEQNALHLPAGQPTRIILSSEDVIHSLYVPAFRIKHDAVPGKSVQFSITPNKPGEYRMQCAEFCGASHSFMAGTVTVMAPEDYAQWKQRYTTEDTLVHKGAALYREHGCSGCHEAGSDIHAPSLHGLYGSRVPMESGGFVEADLAYLRDSILLPGKRITAGYENKMPSFEGVLDEGEIAALLAYLQDLGTETP